MATRASPPAATPATNRTDPSPSSSVSGADWSGSASASGSGDGLDVAGSGVVASVPS